MKKIIYSQYGTVDELQLTEVRIPHLQADTILVKVKAISINPLDWKIFEGDMKMVSGSTFPKGVGIDFSGVVESVGKNIKSFNQNDEVFGLMDVFKGGAMAEYVLVKEANITLKPKNITFAEAAALPVVGLSALHILDKLVDIKQGTTVLVNGATGGIGMIVIQLAKQKGAHITTTSNSKGITLAKKWGADITTDYKTQNIFASNRRFDVVMDFSGKMTFNEAKSLLRPLSTFVSTIPSPKAIIRSALHNLFSVQKHKILLLKPSSVNLQKLARLSENGLDIHIGKAYALTEFKKAYIELKKGGVLGKVVVLLNLPI